MERQFIEQLSARLPRHPQLLLGIGDDAALLRLASRADCVVTADLLADGTHFRLPSDDLRRVGRKALAVNLSDLAAMAARPVAAVVSLLLPRHNALSMATQIYDGMLPMAERFNVAIAGGDTNCWDGAPAIGVTAIGETTTRGVLRRDGALAGDAILVTGSLGGSRLGKHFDFTPRVSEALLLHRRFELHAAMDISDGLLIDLSRICAASGVGAQLDLGEIPISPAAEKWASKISAAKRGIGRTPLEHALSDGEDFELLLTTSAEESRKIIQQQPLDVPITKIGQIVAGSGITGRTASGDRQDLQPLGFEHGKMA